MRRSLVLPPRTAAAGDEDQQHGARPPGSLSPRRAPSVLPRSPELLRMLRAHYAPESAEAAVAASPSTNEHYTDAALLRREALRFDPAVVQALQQLWQLARPLGGAIARFDEERYVRMWVALQRQLAGAGNGGVAAAQLEAEARAEFAVDSQGESALGARAFGTAMFALADLWTTEISVDAHRSFLATCVEPVLRRLRLQDVAAMKARARAVGEAEVGAREAAAAAAAAAALAAGRAAARAAAGAAGAAGAAAAAATIRRRRADTPTRSTPPPPRRQRRRRRPPPESPPAQGRASAWWRARCGGWVPGRCPAGAPPAARGSGECATDCTVDGDDPAIALSCCITAHATVALSLSIVPVPQQQPGGWAQCSAAGQQEALAGAEPPELAAPAAVAQAQAPQAGWVLKPGNAEPCYARAWQRAAWAPTAQGRGREGSSCAARPRANGQQRVSPPAQLRGTARLRAKLQHLGACRDDWRGSRRTDHPSAW